MWFEFEPAVVTLAPGDQAISDLRASGPRRWFGQPVVRPFGVLLAAPGSVPPPVRRSRGWLPTGLVPKKLKLPKGPALPPVPKLPAGGGAPGLPAGPKVPGVKTPAIKAPAVKVPQLTVPRPPSELTIPAWGGPGAGPAPGPEPEQSPVAAGAGGHRHPAAEAQAHPRRAVAALACCSPPPCSPPSSPSR